MRSGEFIIITGLSGAGKSLALRFFEDLDFFCVDNLLPGLIPKFAQLCAASEVNRVAIVTDIRGGDYINDLAQALKEIEEFGFKHEILFLEAPDGILLRRFRETRRKHPLSHLGRIQKVIQIERDKLMDIRGIADKIIDTSEFSPARFRREIVRLFSARKKDMIYIVIVSFGYKFGLPMDADLVFDVRFLPNPFYEDELRRLTGLNTKVQKFIYQYPETKDFLERLFKFVDFLVPKYVEEGKSHLTIAVGCTGGRHRSVYIANKLEKHLKQKKYSVNVEHRDHRK